MTRWAAVLTMTLAFALPAYAQGAKNPPLPWDQDTQMLMAVQPELSQAGIRALASHVPDYEAALKRAPQYFPGGVVIDGRRYVMADGSAQALAALLPATLGVDKDAKSATAVVNVYALIAIQLGTYYNEMDQNEDAVRVLDQGIALDTLGGVPGANVPQMIGEKGFALNREQKFDQALAVLQGGVQTKGITPIDRARLERGEGLALTEMGKLDEAEAAYKASLKDEPGNQRAMNELVYIARLKAGGPKAPVESTLVPPPEDKPKQAPVP